VRGHGAGHGASHALNHERAVVGGEEACPAYGVADFRVAEHVGVGGLAEDLVGGAGGKVVEDDRQSRALAQLDIAVDILSRQGVLEAAGDLVPGQSFEEIGHVVVGAVHGEVVVDLEPPGCHFPHRLGLVEDILEGGEMVLHPGVALLGIALDGFGHAAGMGGDGPAAYRNP